MCYSSQRLATRHFVVILRANRHHSNATDSVTVTIVASVPRHLLSFLLPITALVLVPALIERNPAVRPDFFLYAGVVFTGTGLWFLIATISLFIRHGKGTLAPWDPTTRLIITGPYAYVRNPMITGVLTVLLGEAFVFHSMRILVWCLLFLGINTAYFILSEEPGMERRFGQAYREYRSNVPRWIPRLTPWKTGGVGS